MTGKLLVILTGLISFFAFGTFAAEPRIQPNQDEQARTVYIFHHPVVMLQAKFGLTTPEERVLRIQAVLRSLNEADLREPLDVVSVFRYNQPGKLILLNHKPIMLLVQGDLDEGDDLTLDQAVKNVVSRFEVQRKSLKDQYNSSWIILSVVKTVVSMIGLFMLFYGEYIVWRKLRRYYQHKIIQQQSWLPTEWRRFLGPIESRIFGGIFFLTGCIVAYFWLSWIFSLFPWTRIWGSSLGEWSIHVFEEIALTIVSAMPGLFVITLIFIITTLFLKLIKSVLNQIAAGSVKISWLHPETVGTTRKLFSVLTWLLALSAAYPFLPGANSLAFKGISVFLGLMLTLGSAGVMNHAMSGLVLIYSRALRKGDTVRIADNEGIVNEIGMLATKIITRENYIVTLPNAVVVSGKITGLNSLNDDGGINLTTSVTIGYDTPWRQVHAMLELAATRAKCVCSAIPPVVRQLNLMDWYVCYELQVRLLPGESLASARNELHSHIQDVFNEFEVQIMSPNFVLQPEAPVLVPRENWFVPPAVEPPGTTSKRESLSE
ncbi:mechanosensitive ion channel family protein [Jinshanibacter sp. LJY008]|uniref:Small-conductance mechanosensitive channel n=1 Tax=Limnobaculum eriocheiris TaxID=2897391 RepID=A0A9X1MZ97_9GAMM|nr:mechanosensitive ion channel domain-containing protein [Limnobaculum eriocheiris]MCD1127569.1 mechanosensitive ion channel family protein [Limnobaculum eriocheiris]